jgi:multisubunit Na+/H+ antiporter MnhG subunit
VYPASWLLTTALLLVLFSEPATLQNIDTFQIVLAYLLLFMRRLIISVKYAYFRDEDLERLCLPAPDWDDRKTQRRLVGQGWANPAQFPGLIEDEITCAMDENDICLQGIPVTMDTQSVQDLSQLDSSPLFPAKTSCTKKDEISSGFFLFNIINSVYQTYFVARYRAIIFPCMLAIPATPLLVRSYYDVNLFGITLAEQLVTLASILGFMLGFQLLFFGLICAIDFERRYQTGKKLGDMVKYPGILVSSIFADSKAAEANNRHIFIDLQRRANVFGWMNARKVLRSFGDAFYLRIQAYTSILIFYSLFCIGILNLIVWTEMRHHISTIYVIAMIITIISGISLFAIYKAIKLQSLSEEHRDFVRNQLFILEEEIWELKLSGADNGRIIDLQSAKALLEQVDQSIHYKELIYKPTTILGYAANNGIIGSVMGLVITGCLFAIQGFTSTGISYDQLGWFNF